jgi:NADP-dependent 3-hydroxy acid dehydrogenase YdfG
MTESLLREGAVALVTGASSGIGAGIARALAGERLKVICAARRMERLSDLAREVGPAILPLSFDVTQPEEVARLPANLPQELREIDVLVNAAGHDIGGRRPFCEMSQREIAAIIETNVVGVMALTRALLPGMLERNRGHIVNIGSTAGRATYAGGSVYAPSKFALRAFTDALRKDYRQTSLRFTEIQPGLTRTNFAATRLHGDKTAGERFYDAAPQVLEVEDVVAATLFALKLPGHACAAQIMLTPTQEA